MANWFNIKDLPLLVLQHLKTGGIIVAWLKEVRRGGICKVAILMTMHAPALRTKTPKFR